MKYAAFNLKSDLQKTRVGVVDTQKLALSEYEFQTDLSGDGVLALLKLELAKQSLPKIVATHDLKNVNLLAPVPRPRRNILCVGKNYYDHAKEFGTSGYDSSTAKPGDEIPKDPIIFTKPPETVIGPNAPIVIPTKVSRDIDYEVELTVVIGKGGKGIRKADALKHVWAYTIINDVTARDWQQRHKQWFLGKSFDTFCPMGPWVVTRDELNENDMSVQCWVNGELRQNSNSKDLIFDVPTLIETISAGITLYPGDIIATGTPAGVGLGFKPPKFLKGGDVVRLEIGGIGVLENPLVEA
ncbi:MAG: fumarylacetoacetate hydrolase family protein [Polynucleobacter sp.]|jgi:2-keto-4-pentenoate hydratase/2-oxohepta-3-ene-1,7-dioic acid hydratase in catechol pathway|nr:fumarylacetoacetate hydrolase family protein [Polynucleobacter sp.]